MLSSQFFTQHKAPWGETKSLAEKFLVRGKDHLLNGKFEEAYKTFSYLIQNKQQDHIEWAYLLRNYAGRLICLFQEEKQSQLKPDIEADFIFANLLNKDMASSETEAYPQALFWLGQLQCIQKKWSLNLSFAEIHEQAWRIYSVEEVLCINKMDEVIEQANQGLARMEQNCFLLFLRGRAYLQKAVNTRINHTQFLEQSNNDFTRAIELCLNVKPLAQNLAKYYFLRSEIRVLQKNTIGAIEDFENGMECDEAESKVLNKEFRLGILKGVMPTCPAIPSAEFVNKIKNVKHLTIQIGQEADKSALYVKRALLYKGLELWNYASLDYSVALWLVKTKMDVGCKSTFSEIGASRVVHILEPMRIHNITKGEVDNCKDLSFIFSELQRFVKEDLSSGKKIHITAIFDKLYPVTSIYTEDQYQAAKKGIDHLFNLLGKGEYVLTEEDASMIRKIYSAIHFKDILNQADHFLKTNTPVYAIRYYDLLKQDELLKDMFNEHDIHTKLSSAHQLLTRQLIKFSGLDEQQIEKKRQKRIRQKKLKAALTLSSRQASINNIITQLIQNAVDKARKPPAIEDDFLFKSIDKIFLPRQVAEAIIAIKSLPSACANRTYLYGGYVRDETLSFARETCDYDVRTAVPLKRVAKSIQEIFKLDEEPQEEHGILHVSFQAFLRDGSKKRAVIAISHSDILANQHLSFTEAVKKDVMGLDFIQNAFIATVPTKGLIADVFYPLTSWDFFLISSKEEIKAKLAQYHAKENLSEALTKSTGNAIVLIPVLSSEIPASTSFFKSGTCFSSFQKERLRAMVENNIAFYKVYFIINGKLHTITPQIKQELTVNIPFKQEDQTLLLPNEQGKVQVTYQNLVRLKEILDCINTEYISSRGLSFDKISGDIIVRIKLLQHLETIKEATFSFAEDPIRILRAIYLTTALGYKDLSETIKNAINNCMVSRHGDFEGSEAEAIHTDRVAPLTLFSQAPEKINSWLNKLFCKSGKLINNFTLLLTHGIIEKLFPDLALILKENEKIKNWLDTELWSTHYTEHPSLNYLYAVFAVCIAEQKHTTINEIINNHPLFAANFKNLDPTRFLEMTKERYQKFLNAQSSSTQNNARGVTCY